MTEPEVINCMTLHVLYHVTLQMADKTVTCVELAAEDLASGATISMTNTARNHLDGPFASYIFTWCYIFLLVSNR